ncbi:MAG: MBL fold metallo-hydrolase [Oligosphaeraceae bacterium]|nr:MBL fold metallo-hydrolase [Oligosphaeraceae bacterium]
MTALGVTVLASGSSGNAILVHNHQEGLLIDSGLSLRELRHRMRSSGLPENLVKGILITHEHSDHIRGLRVCAEHFQVPVYASCLCAEKLRYLDPALGAVVRFAPGGEFQLGEFKITPFPLEHDAVDPVGYVISRASRKIGLAMDLGQAGRMTEFQLRSCDTLLLESNHDLNMLAASQRPWYLKQRILGPQGHLSNKQSSDCLARVLSANTRNVILMHLSRECNTEALADASARAELQKLQRTDVNLMVSHQDQPLATAWA